MLPKDVATEKMLDLLIKEHNLQLQREKKKQRRKNKKKKKAAKLKGKLSQDRKPTFKFLEQQEIINVTNIHPLNVISKDVTVNDQIILTDEHIKDELKSENIMVERRVDLGSQVKRLQFLNSLKNFFVQQVKSMRFFISLEQKSKNFFEGFRNVS